MLTWDQAPYWGKKEKKGAVGEKPRGKGDAALSPSPGHRSSRFARRCFFYLTPFFAFFPYCGAWSQATFMLPIVITQCLFSVIFVIGHFRVVTVHIFWSFPNGMARTISFSYRNFRFSLVIVKYPGSLVDRSHVYSYFEKGCRRKMCTRQSRKVIWDMINTLFPTL